MSARRDAGVERDLFELTDVAAVVTGSSRGIGLAIARTLLRQGARVLVNGLGRDETTAAVDALRAELPSREGADARIAGLAGDVTDAEFAHELVEVATGGSAVWTISCATPASTSSNPRSTTRRTSGTASSRNWYPIGIQTPL